ncbi:type 4b pilus protein PilO2 [Enterobacter wuhouensis]|uniref:type 4b pilus protein PilO2 n=1 Tax=Enterobacter wuhouensis TaxID=2529381 RepID=UPI002FD3CFA2
MSDDAYLFTVRDGKSRSRYWLAGMDWAPQEKQKVHLPFLSLKKARHTIAAGVGVHTVTGRINGRDKQRRVAGSGRLPAHHRHHHLCSLALAFSASTRNGYGIYRLSSTDFVFLASINGLPAVTADKTGGADKMQALLALFLSMNEPPVGGWDCLATVESPLDASSLINGLSARTRLRCRVHVDGLQKQRWLLVCAVMLLGAGAITWWQATRPPEEPVLTAEEIQSRARAMFATKPMPQILPHPWATQVTVPALLNHCLAQQSPAPSVLEGWNLASGSCSPEGVSLLYKLMPGGTVEGFLKRSREVFGVTPLFNLKEGGTEARIPLAVVDGPVMNEAVPAPTTQLIRVLSWFQRRQVLLNITEVPQPVSLPGSSNTPPPVRDWSEYAFSFNGLMSPAVLMNGLDNTGIRLTRVTFELNGNAFSYTTEGLIYASTK